MPYSRGVKLQDEVSDKIISAATKMALNNGVGCLSVKAIINELNITNRVFYNRFKNLNEVLECIYQNVVQAMRQCILVEYDGKQDYYEFLIDIAASVLKKTYENKLHFSQYMFEYDSLNAANRNWWMERIKALLQYGIDRGLLKNTDLNLLCYSIWCFCLGFNTSSIGTDLTVDEAVAAFRLGIGTMLEGLRP